MADSTNIILGFDPGGEGNFGWSVCQAVDGAPPLVLTENRPGE